MFDPRTKSESFSGQSISTTHVNLMIWEEVAHADRGVLIKQDAQCGDSWRKPRIASTKSARTSRLLREFGNTYSRIEVVDNRIDWHARAA